MISIASPTPRASPVPTTVPMMVMNSAVSMLMEGNSPWWAVVLPLPQFVVAVPDPVRFAIANPSALRGSAAGAVVIPGVAWSRDSTGTAFDTVAADTPL